MSNKPKRFLLSDIEKFGHKDLYGFEVKQIDKADINQETDIVLGVNKANAVDIVSKYLTSIDGGRVISLFPNTLAGLYE